MPLNDNVVRTKLLDLLREDKVEQFKEVFRVGSVNSTKMKLEDVDYALRVAAGGGAEKCLQFLTSKRYADLLGKTSQGKTPLILAMEAQNADKPQKTKLIELLLKGINGGSGSLYDCYIPYQQLLFGEKPNRPIDLWSAMPEGEVKAKIKSIIEEVMDGEWGSGVASSSEQKEAIRVILNPPAARPRP